MVAQKLLDIEESLIALIDATADSKKRKRLVTLRKKVSLEAGRLIDANLDDSTAQYLKAAAGLDKASEATRKAIRDVNSVQSAINTLAKAIDLVSQLAA